jgi:hypothetical protein
MVGFLRFYVWIGNKTIKTKAVLNCSVGGAVSFWLIISCHSYFFYNKSKEIFGRLQEFSVTLRG